MQTLFQGLDEIPDEVESPPEPPTEETDEGATEEKW